MFNQVRADLSQSLPERGVWEEPGKTGIGFQLTEPDDASKSKRYFGVQAGYESGVYSVSVLPEAIRWGGEALEKLRESVELKDWTHGGLCFYFASEDEWVELRPAVLEFVKTVMANRSVSGESDT